MKVTGQGLPPEIYRPTMSAAPRGHLHAEAIRDVVSTSIPAAASELVQRLLEEVEERLFPGGAHRAESMHTSAIGAMLADARDAAEKSVARAAQLVDLAPANAMRVHGLPDPRIVLAVANDLIASNQLPNYLRAAELGREVITWYEGPLAFAIGGNQAVDGERQTSRHETLRRWWNRAPLLVLLVAWLLSGIIVNVLFKLAGASANETTTIDEFWAMGFPALIVFQFIATVRGALLRWRR